MVTVAALGGIKQTVNITISPVPRLNIVLERGALKPPRPLRSHRDCNRDLSVAGPVSETRDIIGSCRTRRWERSPARS